MITAAMAKPSIKPAQMVVELFTGKSDEQVEFEEYKHFCDANIAEKQRVIDDTAAVIETLRADIDMYKLQAKQLDTDIAAADRGEKEKAKMKVLQSMVEAEAKLADAIETQEQAAEFMQDMVKISEQKSADFEAK